MQPVLTLIHVQDETTEEQDKGDAKSTTHLIRHSSLTSKAANKPNQTQTGPNQPA